MKMRRLIQLLAMMTIFFSGFARLSAGQAVRSDEPPAAPQTASAALAEPRTLIAAGDVWRYFKGLSEPPADWKQIAFDDAAWLSGETGIGYGEAYKVYNRTTLTDMYNKYRAVYLRRTFTLTDTLSAAHVWLRIDYDDGFVAYLNGQEVARRNMGAAHAPAPYTMDAQGYHDAGNPQTIDLTDHLTTLAVGDNVLAVQVHNATISSSDLSITPELLVEDGQGDDLADVLLLYDPNAAQAPDANFRLLAGWYGLKYAAYDLVEHALVPADLLDGAGNPYPLIAASEAALGWLDAGERAVLSDTLRTRNMTLLIYDIALPDSPAVSFLTGGEVTGGFQPVDSEMDWRIGDGMPDVTREFSGQTLDNLIDAPDPLDYGLVFASPGPLPVQITPLIQAEDDAEQDYTLFAAHQFGVGRVLLQGRNAGLALGIKAGQYPMRTLYSVRYLSEIAPQMMALRYAAGDEAWHRPLDSANFTIDDPYLTCDSGTGPCHWKYLYWQALLDEMQAHNFHTTIAMIPKNHSLSKPEVAALIQQNPDYYSLSLHGNNHDNGKPPPNHCPEFSPDYPAGEQDAAIRQGLNRMNQHQASFGLPFDRVMVFPCGGGAMVTFDLLKKHNFNLTANGRETPLDASPVDSWDRRMGPAEMAYNNFPNLLRASADTYSMTAYAYIFDLFRDQPVMLYTHASYELTSVLSGGSEGFNPFADAVNGLSGEVVWQSLEGIAQSLYLQRLDDAGVMEVRMVGNRIRLENPGAQAQAYRVRREENFAYPLHVLVDGVEAPHQALEGQVSVAVTVPAQSSREVLIAYNTGLAPETPPGGVSVTEGGSGAEYTLRLISEPEAVVTVTLTYDGQVVPVPTTLVFTPENWDVPQPVQVSAADDGLAEMLFHRGVITHTLSSASIFFHGIQQPLEVIVRDNDFRLFMPAVQKE